MTNKRTELKGIAKLTLVAVSVAAAIAWIPQSFASETTMTAKDEINLSLRYRLEHVDQDNALKDALASTLRSRLTATKNLSPQRGMEIS